MEKDKGKSSFGGNNLLYEVLGHKAKCHQVRPAWEPPLSFTAQSKKQQYLIPMTGVLEEGGTWGWELGEGHRGCSGGPGSGTKNFPTEMSTELSLSWITGNFQCSKDPRVLVLSIQGFSEPSSRCTTNPCFQPPWDTIAEIRSQPK